MTTFQAIILGIIQGLTEFLPISSTAHLRVIPALLDWDDPGAAFTAVIQWGTWVASVIYFRRDIYRLLSAFFVGLWTGRPFATHDACLAWMIAVGTVPIVVFGLALEKHIKDTFRSLYVIAGAAIVLALVMLLAEWWARWVKTKTDLEGMTWGESLLVGFAQVLAVIPGASRSGVTITGGLFAGLTRATAARFSFLLSLPAVFGAGLHQLYKERHDLLATDTAIFHLVLATVVSGVVGYAAIAFLMAYLRQHSTGVFIVYRILLGIALLILVGQGVIPADAGDKKAPQTDRASTAPASTRPSG